MVELSIKYFFIQEKIYQRYTTMKGYLFQYAKIFENRTTIRVHLYYSFSTINTRILSLLYALKADLFYGITGLDLNFSPKSDHKWIRLKEYL